MAKETYFVVGGRYRNHKGEYEVLEILGSKMRVRYDDWAEQLLDIDRQKRIIENMANEERRSFVKRQEYTKKSQTIEGLDEDVRDFLLRFTYEELRCRKILYIRILQGKKFSLLTKDSVKNLIELMKEKNIARLVSPANAWYIDAGGRFNNRESREFVNGYIKDLGNKGEVFSNMNPMINPYYEVE